MGGGGGPFPCLPCCGGPALPGRGPILSVFRVILLESSTHLDSHLVAVGVFHSCHSLRFVVAVGCCIRTAQPVVGVGCTLADNSAGILADTAAGVVVDSVAVAVAVHSRSRRRSVEGMVVVSMRVEAGHDYRAAVRRSRLVLGTRKTSGTGLQSFSEVDNLECVSLRRCVISRRPLRW